jgi:hypothetical protein
MTKQLSYADSEKFRAEAHKHIGFLLCTPLALNTLHFLVDGEMIDPSNVLRGLVFFIIGYLLIKNSYAIMKKRDEKYVRKFI